MHTSDQEGPGREIGHALLDLADSADDVSLRDVLIMAKRLAHAELATAS